MKATSPAAEVDSTPPKHEAKPASDSPKKADDEKKSPPAEPQRSNHPTEAVRGLAEAHSGRGRRPRVDGCPEGPP
jgi:hypothetical protein